MEESSNGATVLAQSSNLGRTTLSGLGGIGKTTIAVWFAVKYENDYNHVIWVDCGEGKITESIKYLATRLAVPVGDNKENLKPVNLIVIEVYEALQDSKCLFIFDNVDDNNSVKDLLSTICNHDTLITSRYQHWGNSSEYGIEVVPLDVFSKDDALSFLKRGLKDDLIRDEEEIASSIAEHLGYLPLALQVAVSSMNQQSWKPSHYLHLLKTNESRILKENNLEYGKSVSDTLTITINSIAKQADGKLATKILNIISFLSPDNITKDLIHRLVYELKCNSEVDLALTVLKNYSLLTVNSNCVYNIHRLLKKVIRLKTESQHCDLLTKILNLMSQFKDEIKNDHKQHISEVWSCAAEHKSIVDKLPKFFISVVKEKCFGFRHDDSMDFFDKCLPHVDRILGKTDLATLEIKFHLADCLFRILNFNACLKIWETASIDLSQAESRLTLLLSWFSSFHHKQIMLKQKCLEAAQFNIRVVKQKQTEEGNLTDIITVDFTESIVDKFCGRITQLVHLGKTVEAWKLWENDVQLFLDSAKTFNKCISIAPTLGSALIENQYFREASELNDSLSVNLFRDVVAFENVDVDDTDFVQHIRNAFKHKPDVIETVKRFITMTTELDESRKLRNYKLQDADNDTNSDSTQAQFSLNGKSVSELKIFKRLDKGVDGRRLMTIVFKRVQFRKYDLIEMLHHCRQLQMLVLRKVKMIWGCRDRVHLPKLKVFEFHLADDIFWDGLVKEHGLSVVMQSLSFFYLYSKLKDVSHVGLERFSIKVGHNSIDIKSVGASVDCRLRNDNVDEVLPSLHFIPETCKPSHDSLCNILQNYFPQLEALEVSGRGSTLVSFYSPQLKLKKLKLEHIHTIGLFIDENTSEIKYQSLTHLTLNGVTFVASGECVNELRDSLLKFTPQLEELDVSVPVTSRISIDIYHLPRKLKKLTLQHIEISVSVSRSGSKYESLTLLSLNNITFSASFGTKIELCDFVLKFKPHLEELDVSGGWRIFINMNHLPLKLKKLKLKHIEIFSLSINENRTGTKYESLTQLTLNEVTFPASVRSGIELCDSVLKFMPQLEELDLSISTGSGISINIYHLPLILKKLKLQYIKLVRLSTNTNRLGTKYKSLTQLTLNEVTFSASGEGGINLSDCLLKFMPQLEELHVSYPGKSRIYIDRYHLPLRLQKLKLEYIELVRLPTYKSKLNRKYDSLTQLTLNGITFPASGESGIELCNFLLKHLPQLVFLNVSVDKSTPISLEVKNLPAKLNYLKLNRTQLLYRNEDHETAKQTNSASAQNAQLKNIFLKNIFLPRNEMEVLQLFGSSEQVYISGDLPGSRATVRLLEKLIDIKSMYRIEVGNFDWTSDTSGSRTKARYLQLLTIPLGTRCFLIERIQSDRQSGQTPNLLWRGRILRYIKLFA